jgi:serine/threonine-protein phosphatase 4 regulatory subunit 1
LRRYSMAESSSGPLQLTCAFNFPGVAVTIGRGRWGEIKGAYGILAGSMQWRVRRTLAFSLHEMAKILGEDLSEVDLLPVFEEMLGDTDEVSIGVVGRCRLTLSNPI